MRAAAPSRSAGRCMPRAGWRCPATPSTGRATCGSTARRPRWSRSTTSRACASPPGSHTVSGRFEWSSRPESLPLPRRHRHRRPVRGWLARGAARASGWRRVARQAPQRRAGRRHGSAGLSPGAGRDPGLSTDAHPPQRGRRRARRGAGAARCPTDSLRCQSHGRSARAPGARRHACACRCAPGSHEVMLVARGTGVAHDAGAAGRQRRQMAARGNLELRRQRRAARRGGRRRRWHRSRAGQRARASGASTRRSAWTRPRSSTCVERSRGLSNADDNRLSLHAQPVAGLRSSRFHGRRQHRRRHAPRLAARHAGAIRACRARARMATSCW